LVIDLGRGCGAGLMSFVVVLFLVLIPNIYSFFAGRVCRQLHTTSRMPSIMRVFDRRR